MRYSLRSHAVAKAIDRSAAVYEDQTYGALLMRPARALILRTHARGFEHPQ